MAGFWSFSSHIRAGEITATRVNGNTFIFTLTIYGNSNSTAPLDRAIFSFGDQSPSVEVDYVVNENIPPDSYKRIFSVGHTYPGDGFYRVTYQESYRIANIVNIANSSQVNLYLETVVSVSSLNQGNRPPYLTIPPLDKANVGEIFTHNAGAIDDDGDSLSYKLVSPKSALNFPAPGYFTPNNLTMNPITGDLVWNTPPSPGIYNFAFIIEEWKRGPRGPERISFITRDMQVVVEDANNAPPQLRLPEDTCVVAGSTLNKIITATDPDNNSISMRAWPDDYFTVVNPQASPASGLFSWSTTCNDARQQPHSFVFRAEDNHPSNPYTDIRTWLVTVIAPAPTGLSASGTNNNIQLTWNAYPCTNALQIDIYRVECDTSEYQQKQCERGIEGFNGYRRIASVPASSTNYSDATAVSGIFYCYRIVARFPAFGFGESYASSKSCAALNNNAPQINAVSVLTTNLTNGTIEVIWSDPEVGTPPYTYNVWRSANNTNNFTQIASNASSPFQDNGLNTEQNQYFYRIELAGISNSSPVSATRLTASGENQLVRLRWSETANWFNDSAEVYRSINGNPFTFVRKLIPDQGQFNDTPLQNCDTVCYYIKGYHHYCLPGNDSSFSQLSQQACAVPKDNRPPDGPVLTVKGCNGNTEIFSNLLSWTDVENPLCPNLSAYQVFYAEYEDSPWQLLATLNSTQLTYEDIDSNSLSGCYMVKAITYDGVAGEESNKVCVDACVYYELPNLITPNGDYKNDVMNPFPVPRGVELVSFKVYNRWGQLLYEDQSGPYLNWPGKDNRGDSLLDGIYFYSAEVKYFRRLNQEDEKQLIKGWVHIVDQKPSARD
jgi:hypothetical protein